MTTGRLFTRRRALAGTALPALATALAALPTAHAARPFDTEMIVRTPPNLRSAADVERLVDLAARHQVAVLNIAAKQDEDDEVPSGMAFYASTIAPRAPGYESFDALDATIAAAHRSGIKVRAWVPQFHDRMASLADPDQEMLAFDGARTMPFAGSNGGEHFVNPLSGAAQAYQRSLLREIAQNYDLDGIVLDWVRFDDYNMDLGPETRRLFGQQFGVDPIVIDFATDNPNRILWNTWRTRAIAEYVVGVRHLLDETRRGLALGVYILPPEFVEVAQDAGQFAHAVNFLSPMAYFKDWGKNVAWVNDSVLAQTKAKAAGAAIVPVFDCDWAEDDYRQIVTGIRQGFPEIGALSWFAYGRWSDETFRRIAYARSF